MREARRTVLRWLREQVQPGETTYVKAKEVAADADLSPTVAGETLAALAGEDLYGYPVAPMPVFEIGVWASSSSRKVYRVHRPEAYGAVWPSLGPGRTEVSVA